MTPVVADDALMRSVGSAFPPGIAQAAVAVSGGGDSIALLHLLARCAPGSGLALRAVTVDHRLRPESAAEAAFVARVCARLAVPHTVLTWDRGALTGNLMEQARHARYRLMTDWAQANGVQAVALGHTADDQAEGFLMALTRASGLDGLSGMMPMHQRDGLVWARPLLAHSRAALRDWLVRQGEPWVEDPSNADAHYLRVRARAALAGLAAMGLTAETIARSVAHLAVARSVLDADLQGFVRRHVVEDAGVLTVDRAAFANLHPEMQRRLLASAVRWIGGAAHPPRHDGQAQALMALHGGRGATLGGVRLRVGPQAIRMAREPRAAQGPVPVGQVWDGRWQVTGAAGEVRALGAAGLAQIPGWRGCGVPRDALVVSPGIWDGTRLIAAPLARFGSGYSAMIGRSFGSFLLSH